MKIQGGTATCPPLPTPIFSVKRVFEQAYSSTHFEQLIVVYLKANALLFNAGCNEQVFSSKF